MANYIKNPMLDKAKGESENTNKKKATEKETIGREFYFCFH